MLRRVWVRECSHFCANVHLGRHVSVQPEISLPRQRGPHLPAAWGGVLRHRLRDNALQVQLRGQRTPLRFHQQPSARHLTYVSSSRLEPAEGRAVTLVTQARRHKTTILKSYIFQIRQKKRDSNACRRLLCFSVRAERPGGGLLLSGAAPRRRVLLWQPVELLHPENIQDAGSSTPGARIRDGSTLLTGSVSLADASSPRWPGWWTPGASFLHHAAKPRHWRAVAQAPMSTH